MLIKEVGIRGIQFTFDELLKIKYHCITNMFAINAADTFYICDTYLGPSYMRQVKDYLEKFYGVKKYVIFNSHSHGDVTDNSAIKRILEDVERRIVYEEFNAVSKM